MISFIGFPLLFSCARCCFRHAAVSDIVRFVSSDPACPVLILRESEKALSKKPVAAQCELSGRVGVSPAERRILRRGLPSRWDDRSGETPEPAGETPTLPDRSGGHHF